MRKVLVNLAVTLDGYIAGPNGEYDWCLTDADYGITAFLESVDDLLIGRKSFDIMLQYGPPYADKTHYVFSRTMKGSAYENVVIVNNDIPAFVAQLKKKEGRNLWLYGGGELIDVVYEAGLIDELHLSVHPLVLGNGIPLFKKAAKRNLQLLKSIPYESGLVQLIYRIPH